MSITTLVTTCLWFLLASSFTGANKANVDCLRSIKSRVDDPNGYLYSWDFSNQTEEGFICKFSGVTCWHDDENRVLSINLSGFGLGGEFPFAVKSCSDLTDLQLSRNNFSGPLPSNMTSFIPSLTILDLSYNHFSGEIPAGLSNMTYLNTLNLQDNQFTGQLPPELVLLGRLSKFSVANNSLTGPIPNFNTTTLKIVPDNFANNPDLCGRPLLDACPEPEDEMIRLGKIDAAVGAAIFAPVGAFLSWFFFSGRKERRGDTRRNRNWIFHIAD